MKGSKITCATCVAEYKGKCNAKKGRPSISLNKRRRCDKYVLEITKVKAKQILKTVHMGYKEKEALKREYKEQIKQLRSAVKQHGVPKNAQYPLTGDLSRFTSTADGDRSDG